MPRGRKAERKKPPIKDFLDRQTTIYKPNTQEEVFEEMGPLEGTIKPMKYESGGEAEMKEAAKKARLRRLGKQSMPILEFETRKMIEDFQNDRSPIFDRRMFDQPESEGGDPKGMKKGGMTCPHRPDGIRGVGKAIKGFKDGGCK